MVPPELVRNVTDAMGCAFQTVYGQTETAPLISQHHLGEALDDICNTIGQPMPDVYPGCVQQAQNQTHRGGRNGGRLEHEARTNETDKAGSDPRVVGLL